MLHIVNGEAALADLRGLGIPGTFVAWNDVMMEGPLRGALRQEADFAERADDLARRCGIPRDRYLAGVRHDLAALDAAHEHDEVVLWFGDDWFCQANLLHVLEALRHAEPLRFVPSPEPLRSVGAEGVVALFQDREPLDPAMVRLAKDVWPMVRATTPEPLGALATTGDFAAWPALHRGLLAHLARFPDPKGGLGVVERRALEAMKDKPVAFRKLFAALGQDATVAALGPGDTLALACVQGLAGGARPLARARGRGLDAVFEITDDGRAALAGRLDAVHARGVDGWLGGVRLEGTTAWRWDAQAKRLAGPR